MLYLSPFGPNCLLPSQVQVSNDTRECFHGDKQSFPMLVDSLIALGLDAGPSILLHRLYFSHYCHDWIPGKFQVISTLSELLMNHAYSCLAWLDLTINQQKTLKWLFLKFNGLLHPMNLALGFYQRTYQIFQPLKVQLLSNYRVIWNIYYMV